MITLTFAGDESGDVSFAFDKGASCYFVVAVIATAEPDARAPALDRIAPSFRASGRLRVRLQRFVISQAPRTGLYRFGKRQLRGLGRGRRQDDTPGSLQGHAPVGFIPLLRDRVNPTDSCRKTRGATLILDEFGSSATMRTELRRFMAARGISRHFKRVLVKRSKSEALIQVADLIAGAILRRDTRSDAWAYDCVAAKLRQVYEFRG